MKIFLRAASVLGAALLFPAVNLYGQCITSSLDHWACSISPQVCAGCNGPQDTRTDHFCFPAGTGPCTYSVTPGLPGYVEFWVYDPGSCCEDRDLGYPSQGPMWGFKYSDGNVITVGIHRKSYIAWCQGYSPWTTANPWSPVFYKGGVRCSHGFSYTPGWYKWSVEGTADQVAFGLYDVDHHADNDPNRTLIHGDVLETYDASSWSALFADVLGNDITGFYLKGDGSGGPETICVQVTAGTGVFSSFACQPVSRAYQVNSWGIIKTLFR